MDGHTDTGAAVHELRIVERSAGWAMGEIGGCLLVVWRAQPTAEAYRTRNRALQDLVERHAGHCALVEVIERTSTPPANDARRVAMQVFNELGPRLCAIGFFVDGSQARVTLNRAIITTMMFFVKQPQPTKVYKSIGETVAWVRGRVKGSPDLEQQLARGLDELRRSIP